MIVSSFLCVGARRPGFLLRRNYTSRHPRVSATQQAGPPRTPLTNLAPQHPSPPSSPTSHLHPRLPLMQPKPPLPVLPPDQALFSSTSSSQRPLHHHPPTRHPRACHQSSPGPPNSRPAAHPPSCPKHSPNLLSPGSKTDPVASRHIIQLKFPLACLSTSPGSPLPSATTLS